MYKLILLVSLVFFFVGCDKTNSTPISPEKPLSYSPLKIGEVKYDQKNILDVVISGDIYVAAIRDKSRDISIDLGRVYPTGLHKNMAVISDLNSSYLFRPRLDTDGQHIVVGEPSPNEFYLYKIEENTTVSKGQKIVPPGASDVGRTIAGDILVDGETIAVSELLDDNVTVLIYKIVSDTNISLIQEISSKRGDTDASEYFGENLALDADTLAVAEGCYVNLYQREENGTFMESDSFLLDETYADDYCGLSLELHGNHLAVGSSRKNEVYLYKVHNGKVTNSQKISNENNLRYFGRSIALMNKTLVVGSYPSSTLYRIDDNGSSAYANKYMDINIAAYLLSAGEKYFVATSLFRADGFSIFDTYPLRKIFVYNDPNEAVKVDEGEVYSFYTLKAGSPAGDLSYTLSGDDASYFELNGTNLINVARFDYENPVDANMDNNYTLNIDISDAEGNFASVALNVQVINREYMLQSRLVNSDAQEFGKALSIDHDSLLIGAKASAYLYDINTTLTKITKITPEDNTTDTSFGSSLAKSGNTLLVGAFEEDINDSEEGAAYLFTLDTNNSIIKETKIVAPTLEAHAYFGKSVVIDGNLSVIGAPGRIYAYRHPGKVYLYTNESNGSVTLAQTLESNESQQMDSFGEDIALSPKYLVVGAPDHSSNQMANVGMVSIYKRDVNNSVTLFKVLEARDKSYGQYFGYSIAVDGEYLIVSAPGNNDVYVYKVSDTDVILLRKIHGDDDLHFFGGDISIHGKDIVITNFTSGYERLDHYVIKNDSVSFVETIINHDRDINSYYHTVAQGDSVMVSGALSNNMVSLFKKE